ncbi:MAG: hypothetical protein LW694_11245 [Chitinophagaceae bacterium]|jgi:hypothetical protein|nr:hypothetical protein [Chitinophagaceae bacterium]
MHYTMLYIRQLLVDASASMDVHQEALTDILQEHFGEFNHFVDRHPEAEHRFGLSTFTTGLFPIIEYVRAAELHGIRDMVIITDGDTALFDIFWRQLDVLEEWIGQHANDERVHVDLHLISDGMDTASTVVRFADLRQRIEALQATGRWTFHFHEADLDRIELHALLGLRKQLAETADPRQLREALVDFMTPGTTKDGVDQPEDK